MARKGRGGPPRSYSRLDRHERNAIGRILDRGIHAVSGKPFIDCSKKTPHYKEVCWLASNGVSGGREFRSYNNVARADMAAFLHRMKDKASCSRSF